MSEDFLTEKEFNELKDLSKWSYVSSLYKLITQLKIQADKNCELCEKQMLDVHDLNIDYLFEDWRSCSQQCDECSTEERQFMCDLQFQLMNHLANSLTQLRERQNAIAKLFLRKDEHGSKLLKEITKKKDKDDKRSQSLYQ